MIVARMSNGVFVLGVDAENIRRLKDGQPILKSLSQFGGTDDVLIMYGDTLQDIQASLEETFGDLPEPQELKSDA